MKYRKKPVVIEAMRIVADDNNRNEDGSESFLDPNRTSVASVSGWLLGHGFRDFKVHGDGPFGLAISTLEGVMIASPGDWVIKEPFPTGGRLFYPCKEAIFQATYEPVEETP